MTDKNGDGRVDVITWSSDGITDQKIDSDFDGRFDRWIVHRGQTVMDLKFKRGHLVSWVSERKFGNVVARIWMYKSATFQMDLSRSIYAYARDLSFLPVSATSEAEAYPLNCGDLKQRIDTSAEELYKVVAGKAGLGNSIDPKCNFSSAEIDLVSQPFQKIGSTCISNAFRSLNEHLKEQNEVAGRAELHQGSSGKSFVLPDKEEFLDGLAFAQARLLGECAGNVLSGCPTKRTTPIIICQRMDNGNDRADKGAPLARMDPAAMTIELNLNRIDSKKSTTAVGELIQHDYLHLAMVNLCRVKTNRPYCEEGQQEAFVKAILNVINTPGCGASVTFAIPAADAAKAQAQAAGGMASKTIGDSGADRIAGLSDATHGTKLQRSSPGITDGVREVAATGAQSSSDQTPVIERPVPQDSEFRTIAPSIESAASRLEGLTFGDTPSQLVMDTTKRAATDVMDRVDRAWDKMAGYIKREALPMAEASEPVQRQARNSGGGRSQMQGAREAAPSRARDTEFDSGDSRDISLADTGASAKVVKDQVAKAGLGRASEVNVAAQIQNARENVNESLALQAQQGQETSDRRRVEINEKAATRGEDGGVAKGSMTGGGGSFNGSGAARPSSTSAGKSSALRAPAAINPKAMIDALAKGSRDEVKAVSVELLRQNLLDKKFRDQLEEQGVAVIDTNKKSYGAPYRSARRKYLIRDDETLTIMGSAR